MSNIYPIGQTCQYLLSRAKKNHLAGKYDQAMKLLIRAREAYPEDGDVEFEIASIYDEIGCEDAAVRTYLRVVRIGGKRRAQALFRLALTHAQHGDLRRADSYLSAFMVSDREGVSEEMSKLLERQIDEAMAPETHLSRKSRAKQLEKRAVEQLHAGRIHAAKRNAQRAITLHETPARRLLKACTHLMLDQAHSAAQEASAALLEKPVYVQALCVLADAYVMLGRRNDARHAIFRAAKQAKSTDSLLSVAVECTKLGYDNLTLILTRRILRREPFHVRAMAMRACAHMNLGNFLQAEKLFARLSVLMPEDGIFESYFTAARDGKPPAQRLVMAQDVTQQEAMDRGVELLCVLQEEPDDLRASKERLARLCRIASWALYSSYAGDNMTLVAVVILGALDTPQTRSVLYDALVSPQLSDQIKQTILKAAAEHCAVQPVYADLGGEYVRIAAGSTMPALHGEKNCQAVVQRAADALLRRYPDGAQQLLHMWIRCCEKYGSIKENRINVCAAALEYAYHLTNNRCISADALAGRYGVSKRLLRLWSRRIISCLHNENNV